jgi:CRISPR/Cas system CSM-associated protein Csm3 (group 7 of RAMP superfamily)
MKRVDRVEVSYNLIFTTPFHFGTGLRVGLIDRTVVRDSSGHLYVPGSTIKGVLREECERLSRLYEVLDEEMYEFIASPHDTETAMRARQSAPTMITRIFGSQNSPGRLFFDNAHQTREELGQYDRREGDRLRKGKYNAAQTELATQVRLDRPTRTSARGALYTSEFGIKNLIFEGAVTGWLECTPIDGIEKGPTYSLLLLLAGMHLLTQIGGNKSTGKGQCRCEITALTCGKEKYEKDAWQEWFNYLDALSFYSSHAVSEGEQA